MALRATRRKIIAQVIVFVLLGMIVNVAVAWGCAAWLFGEEPRRESLTVSRDHYPAWLVGLTSRRGHSALVLQSLGTDDFFEMFRRMFDLSSPQVLAMIPADHRQVPDGCYQQCAFSRDWSGWPMHSLSCDTAGTLNFASRIVVDATVTSGIAMMPVNLPPTISGFRNRALPLRPIWPGFAINTIFYGAVLWLLFAFPFILRRRRRLKRGQCPACAYPIGASSICTECGKPVTPRAL